MKYNIQAKASMHVGKKYSLKHNLRDYDVNKWNTDGHIQSERSCLNKVLIHNELSDFFRKTFEAAIEEYNEKNMKKHPDRITSVDEYYNKYKGQAQECIMQMGDHENYIQLVEIVGQDKADEIHKEFLTRAYENWIKDNSSLKVFSATIHMDEIKDGTPHIHLDFIPIAESSRGLTVKISMDGAMRKLGYNRKTKSKDGQNDEYNETPYRRWLSQQRKCVESLAADYIDLIPSEPFTKHRRQEIWQWRAKQKEKISEDVKKLSESKIQAEKDIENLRKEYKQYRELEVSKEEISQKIKIKTSLFGKNETVSLNKSDFNRIQEQSTAYIANYDKIKSVDERISDINKKEKLLNEVEKRLEEKRKFIEQQLETAYYATKESQILIKSANSKKTEAEKLYSEQLNINEILKDTQMELNNTKEKVNEYCELANKYKHQFHNTDLKHKSEVKQLQEENNDLKKQIKLVVNNFFILLNSIVSISNYLKYMLHIAELPDKTYAQLKATQKYTEEMIKKAPLMQEEREIINNRLKNVDLHPKITEYSKKFFKEKQELSQNQTQHYGMTR